MRRWWLRAAPPPIIFEWQSLAQQIRYRWKRNFTENRIHIKYRKNTLISRFYGGIRDFGQIQGIFEMPKNITLIECEQIIYHFELKMDTFYPLSSSLFSSSPGLGRGLGSRARMPKTKVTLSWLKWNFAWVIRTIKACLMQNLSLLAFLFLEIWYDKVSL